jgi:hypothetical protein
MIITDRFIALNNPKTGSTFVRTVLKRVHGDTGRRGWQSVLDRLIGREGSAFAELMLPNTKPGAPRPRDQHGTFAQIPPEQRGKEVMSVVRNPFTRLLSTYRFRWWVRDPPADPALLTRRFPCFPELTLEEFLLLEDIDLDQRVPGKDPAFEVGFQTVQFIQMFFRDPASVLRKLDDSYLDSDRFIDDLPPISFLQTERLNRALYDFLLAQGYNPARIAFILNHERLNISRGGNQDGVWSDSLVERVLRRERLLFRILDHLGFAYTAPSARSRGM